MRSIRPRHPSHATVIAYLALFVALSGTALAASKVKSGDIKNGAVTKKKIHKQAVTTSRLDDSAVTTEKLADLAVTQGKLGDDSVSNGKLQSDSVSQGKLQGDSVSQGKIEQNAISTGKIQANAITGDKVLNGALTLSKTAQVIGDATLPSSMLNAGTCLLSDPVTVSGLQSANYVDVIPKVAGWNQSIVLDSYQPFSSTQIRFRVCNIGAGTVDVAGLSVRILGFS